MPQPRTEGPRPTIPRTIWALGFVSLFTDMGSEMVHSLLPVLLATGLGASALTIGLIEGAAEATVLVTKVFSGWASDALGRRKPLVLLGYGLAAASKPLFPLAGSVAAVATARLVDRFDKVILVDSTRPRRLERLVQERQLPEAEAMKMIAAQMPAELKRARADFIIDNDGTIADLEKRVRAAWAELSADERARSAAGVA